MSKDIKYSKLLKETFSSLNPLHWGRVGFNWLVKGVDPIHNPKYTKYKKNINLIISSCVLQPSKKINSSLSDRELKAICYALEYPYHKDRDKLIDELRGFIYDNSLKVYPKIEKEYLDKLDEDQLIAFWSEYCDVNEEKLGFHPEMTKRSHIYAHLRPSFHEKVTRAENFEKDFYSGRLELGKIYQNFLFLYSGILSSDNISKEIDDLTKNIFC